MAGPLPHPLPLSGPAIEKIYFFAEGSQLTINSDQN